MGAGRVRGILWVLQRRRRGGGGWCPGGLDPEEAPGGREGGGECVNPVLLLAEGPRRVPRRRRAPPTGAGFLRVVGALLTVRSLSSQEPQRAEL